MPVLLKMIKEFSVQKYFAVNVLRHSVVGILNKVNYVSNWFVLFDMFEQLLDD